MWVLRKIYDYKTSDISAAIRVLLATKNVEMNSPAVEAGLNQLEAGADFADGVIAYEGSWLGADINSCISIGISYIYNTQVL